MTDVVTGLAVVPPTSSLAKQASTLTREHIELLKRTICKGSTDAELDLFVHFCRRLEIDPFARQAFMVPRWDDRLGCSVMQPQVSIDGFRLIAERTGQYRGQTEPEWCGRDGKWVNVWLEDGPPAAARCGVYREGFAAPLVRVARYTSYVQRNRKGEVTKTWATMPDVMLSKCAEMLGLRAAFPNELGGVYGLEEMGQAQEERPPSTERTREDRKTFTPRNDPRRQGKPAPSRDVSPQDSKVGIDSHGIRVPRSPVPIFEAEGPNKGKRWSDVPIEVIVGIYDEGRGRMSARQREHCEYLIAVDALKKKKSAIEAEAAQDAPKDGAS